MQWLMVKEIIAKASHRDASSSEELQNLAGRRDHVDASEQDDGLT
jgi:hypothetical protein